MSRLMCFLSAFRHDPAIELWMPERESELGELAWRWFQVMRGCGDDLRELLHDGHPTADTDMRTRMDKRS